MGKTTRLNTTFGFLEKLSQGGYTKTGDRRTTVLLTLVTSGLALLTLESAPQRPEKLPARRPGSLMQLLQVSEVLLGVSARDPGPYCTSSSEPLGALMKCLLTAVVLVPGQYKAWPFVERMKILSDLVPAQLSHLSLLLASHSGRLPV